MLQFCIDSNGYFEYNQKKAQLFEILFNSHQSHFFVYTQLAPIDLEKYKYDLESITNYIKYPRYINNNPGKTSNRVGIEYRVHCAAIYL